MSDFLLLKDLFLLNDGIVMKLNIHPVCCCIQEKILLEPMFDVPDSDIEGIIVTREVVTEGQPVSYVRPEPKQLGNQRMSNTARSRRRESRPLPQ